MVIAFRGLRPRMARVHEEERGGRRRATRPPKAGRRPETNLSEGYGITVGVVK